MFLSFFFKTIYLQKVLKNFFKYVILINFDYYFQYLFNKSKNKNYLSFCSKVLSINSALFGIFAILHYKFRIVQEV